MRANIKSIYEEVLTEVLSNQFEQFSSKVTIPSLVVTGIKGKNYMVHELLYLDKNCLLRNSQRSLSK